MLNTPVYYPYPGTNRLNMNNSFISPSPGSPAPSGQPQSTQLRSFLPAGNMKDSRWLTLEVCRQFQRNACTRDENDCKFAHPPPHVEVQYGRVMCCYDSIKGKCQRKDPQCKYLHPPSHLRDQLVQNGRNNLFWKSLQLQILQQHQHQLLSAPQHLMASQRGSQSSPQALNSIQQNPDQPKLIYQNMNLLTTQQNQNALQFLNGNAWLDNLLNQLCLTPEMYATNCLAAENIITQNSRKRPIDATTETPIACNSQTLEPLLVPMHSTATSATNNLGIKINNYVNGVYEQDLLTNMGLFHQPNSNCIQSMINPNENIPNNSTQIYTQISGINNLDAKRHAIIDTKSGLPIYQTTPSSQQHNGHSIDQQNHQSSVILDPQIIQSQVNNGPTDIQLMNAIVTASGNSPSCYVSY